MSRIRSNRLRSDGIELFMECEEEELSEAQVKAFKRAEKEHQDAVKKINKLKLNDVKIIYGNHNSVLPPESENLRPVPTYKLLLDARTGLILGTLPSEGATPITSQAFVPLSNQIKDSVDPTGSTKQDAQKTQNNVISTPVIKNVKQSDDKSDVLESGDSSEGQQRIPSQYPSLTIKAVPQRSASLSVVQCKRNELDKAMSDVLRRNTSGLVKWMFEHGLFQIEQFCCDTKMKLVFDSRHENDNSGGYKWQCTGCGRTLPIQHRSFFENHGLLKMLRIVYYWACNEDVQKVLAETKVPACFLKSVYSLLRSICKAKTATKLGGCDSRPVEVSVTLLKNTCMHASQLYLGCIFERISGMVALRAFTAKTDAIVEEFVRCFVAHSSVINTDKSVKLSASFLNNENHKCVATNDQGCVILNARAYTQERVIPTFGGVLEQLQMETIQSFLSELMWREKFGTNPYNAFNNILLHIKQHYGTGTSSPKAPLEMIADKRKRDVKEDLILLDDYYYAWQSPSFVWKNKSAVESGFKFKCYVCKKILDNNIKLMRHLYAHIENSKQRNLDLSDVTQCKYCFREFETPYSMQCHLEEVHLKNSNPLTCRICDRAFDDRSTLINHMYRTHTAAEMPYSCDVCKYRCSMYRKLLDHFQEEHNGTNCIQCHHCLKVFNVKFSSVQQIGLTNNFWTHIYKHQTKSLSRKCNACCLTFIGLNELKQHRLYDHVSNLEKTGVFKFPSANNQNEIYIREPPLKQPKLTRTRTPTRRRPHLTDVNGNLQLQDADGLQCLECRSGVKFPDHFLKNLCCSQCCYATNCGKAFANHMIFRHARSRKKDDNCFPVYLPTKMFCVCGYSHHTGNTMAKHLVLCGKRSCYPTWESAADQKIENIISENSASEEKKKKFETQDDNPPMLNVLGLMRNPAQDKRQKRKKTTRDIEIVSSQESSNT